MTTRGAYSVVAALCASSCACSHVVARSWSEPLLSPAVVVFGALFVVAVVSGLGKAWE